MMRNRVCAKPSPSTVWKGSAVVDAFKVEPVLEAGRTSDAFVLLAKFVGASSQFGSTKP
jgi:hypothetical protein